MLNLGSINLNLMMAPKITLPAFLFLGLLNE